MLRTVSQQAIRAQRVFTRHAATSSTTPMLCMQCEQTEGNVGCTTVGVCGKTPEAAAVQDLLVEAVRAASQLALTVPTTPEEDHLVLEAMFSTLTNVNFDVDALAAYVVRMDDMVTRMKAAAPGDHGVAFALEGKDAGSMILQGLRVGVTARQSKAPDADIFSLQELITYGCKGMAAYAHHADALGMRSADVQRVLYEAMAMTNSSTVAAGDLVGMALKVGEANVTTMAMLSDGHKARFGVPEPSPVSLRPTAAGKCVLVSGHDIADLEAVLKAAEGTDVGVYTHGELLPAHGYPSIKSHPNLRGNYGGAWQNQKVDFAEFPGPILMTTNCLVEPRKSYADRTYTCNAVGFEGIKHVKDRDFAPMIAQAQAMEGFTEDDIEDAAENAEGDATSMTGFGHDAVLGIADQVIGAIDSGKLRHIFFVGGCDGSEGERNYFRDFALGLPDDTVVLTAGCGKYRFNKEMERMGAVPGTGLPRMLDMGQCNDSYSAVKVALALAEHYKTDVNSLPLSLVVSWFEQKAVAVLLSLLHLGVQDIRLGPNLPAFISPGVLGVLVENFAIKPCSPNADTDIATILSPPAQEEARA